MDAPQAASTLAVLARNPDLVAPQAAHIPIEQIAQTPAAAAALAQRAEMINSAINGQIIAKGGKPAEQRRSARKF